MTIHSEHIALSIERAICAAVLPFIARGDLRCLDGMQVVADAAFAIGRGHYAAEEDKFDRYTAAYSRKVEDL